MPNPFTFYNPAATAKEHQSNANYWTYAKMDAIGQQYTSLINRQGALND